MIPSIMQCIAAHLHHPDMSTFVGAVLAMLLCATFLDAPKKYFKTWLNNKGNEFIQDSRKKLLLLKTSASSLAEQLEDIELDYKDYCEKTGNLIRWCNTWLYTPSAFIFGLLALAELFLGKTQLIGYWNILLLSPFALFFIPLIIYLIYVRKELASERKSFEKRLKRRQNTGDNTQTKKREDNIMELLNDN